MRAGGLGGRLHPHPGAHVLSRHPACREHQDLLSLAASRAPGRAQTQPQGSHLPGVGGRQASATKAVPPEQRRRAPGRVPQTPASPGPLAPRHTLSLEPKAKVMPGPRDESQASAGQCSPDQREKPPGISRRQSRRAPRDSGHFSSTKGSNPTQ